jgi:hypothetical protein
LFDNFITNYGTIWLTDVNKNVFISDLDQKTTQIKSSYLFLSIKNMPIFGYFLTRGVNIELLDDNNRTILLYALDLNLVEIANDILSFKPNIQVITKDNRNALDISLLNDMDSISLKLIAMGLNINMINIYDVNYLLLNNKSIQAIRYLLLTDTGIINTLIDCISKSTMNMIDIETGAYMLIDTLFQINMDEISIINKLLNITKKFKIYNYITSRQKNNTNRISTFNNLVEFLGYEEKQPIDNNILTSGDYYNIKLIEKLINYNVDKLKKFNINELLLKSVSSSTIYVQTNYFIFINWLIEIGANINLEDVDKNNLLLISIDNMELKLVEYFITMINFELKNSNDDNVFHISVKNYFKNLQYDIYSIEYIDPSEIKKRNYSIEKIFILLLDRIKDKSAILERMLKQDKNKNNMTVVDIMKASCIGKYSYLKWYFIDLIKDDYNITIDF